MLSLENANLPRAVLASSIQERQAKWQGKIWVWLSFEQDEYIQLTGWSRSDCTTVPSGNCDLNASLTHCIIKWVRGWHCSQSLECGDDTVIPQSVWIHRPKPGFRLRGRSCYRQNGRFERGNTEKDSPEQQWTPISHCLRRPQNQRSGSFQELFLICGTNDIKSKTLRNTRLWAV